MVPDTLFCKEVPDYLPLAFVWVDEYYIFGPNLLSARFPVLVQLLQQICGYLGLGTVGPRLTVPLALNFRGDADERPPHALEIEVVEMMSSAMKVPQAMLTGFRAEFPG